MDSIKKKLKRQKITIIVLSIFLSIIIFYSVAMLIYDSNNNINTVTIYFETQTFNTNSILPFNEFQITCNKDTLIKVSNFSYKGTTNNEERYTPANGLVCNDKEYAPNESFIIYANKVNKITIHGSINADTNTVIYYKHSPIKLHEKKSFQFVQYI